MGCCANSGGETANVIKTENIIKAPTAHMDYSCERAVSYSYQSQEKQHCCDKEEEEASTELPVACEEVETHLVCE